MLFSHLCGPMLTEEELIKAIALGEDSSHQFKREMNDAESLAAEMVAMSNSLGGYIIIGVADDGTVVGVPGPDKPALNNRISNVANQQVKPPVYPITQWFSVHGNDVLVIEMVSSPQRPHCDSKGRYFVKVGSDKRAAAPEELLRMFQEAQRVYLDELPTPSLISELDRAYFYEYFTEQFPEEPMPDEKTLPQVLSNLKLAEGPNLNLAGLLLFGQNPQVHRPYCMVKAVSFSGIQIHDTRFEDKEDIIGNLEDIYQRCLSFLRRNLKRLQVTEEFNRPGRLEISESALTEALINALVHRDYSKAAPIRLLVFTDRVEIISPGKLPNHLTIENIRLGNSVQRNPTILSYAARILPYTGIGSGIRRILSEHPATELINDEKGEEFKVILKRP